MFHLSISNSLAAASCNQALLLLFTWFLDNILKNSYKPMKISFFDSHRIRSSDKKQAAYSLCE